MTDRRRAWWTDDLIESVKDAISGYCFDHVEGPLYDDDVYPVIAAVEEQHYAELREQAERAGQGLDVEALISARMEHVARAENAEAAIARVRERAGGPIPAVHGDWMAGYAAAMRDILFALGHDIEMDGKR